MTDFLKFAAICILLLAIVAGALYGLSYAWTDFTGQQEMRRLEAEAARAQADAARVEAEANRTREQAGLVQAEAGRELARGEADAIRAPALAAAKTVNRQSAIMWYWGVLTPLALLFTALVLVVAGFTLGTTTVMGGVAFVKLGVSDHIQSFLQNQTRAEWPDPQMYTCLLITPVAIVALAGGVSLISSLRGIREANKRRAKTKTEPES